MTKSRTKARKLADKRRLQLAGMELAPTPKRSPSGRPSRAGDADPQRVVLSARCLHMGKSDNRDNRRMMKSQMMGDPAGQAIAIGARNPAEADSLWQTFSDLDAVDAAYHSRILGRSRHAKCGKVEYMPERLETRPDDAPSYRDPADIDRAVTSAWMRWHGHLGHLSKPEQSAIWDGIYLRCDLHRTGIMTTGGTAFVAAMRLLHDVVQRRT